MRAQAAQFHPSTAQLLPICQVSAKFSSKSLVIATTHRAQCNRGSSQPDQASIAGMGLVHGVRVVVAELFNDFLYFLLLSSENSIADNFLKPSANEQ
jgi:hypothetical protein